MTTAELAVKSGVSIPTVTKLEKGKRIKRSLEIKILRTLGVYEEPKPFSSA